MTNENQLMVIVEQSGLEKTKADYILENFTSYFSIAAEWEKRAKEIVVSIDFNSMTQKDFNQFKDYYHKVFFSAFGKTIDDVGYEQQI